MAAGMRLCVIVAVITAVTMAAMVAKTDVDIRLWWSKGLKQHPLPRCPVLPQITEGTATAARRDDRSILQVPAS
jgi:hypothetical protein